MNEVLDRATCEQDMQKFLAANPLYLVQHLGGGHGRWVIPQCRLGSHYVADFIVGEKHSFGHEWQLVELESPCAKMFTKSGNPSSTLTHAIRQIQDWRAWIHSNQAYAAGRTDDAGLGLLDIVGDVPGLIIVGRRKFVDDSTHRLRRQMMRDLKIQIRTYDSFCDSDHGIVVSESFHLLGRQIKAEQGG